jgi:hypothetical protein
VLLAHDIFSNHEIIFAIRHDSASVYFDVILCRNSSEGKGVEVL